MARWGVELLFGVIYLFSTVGVLIFATRKNKPLLLVFGGAVIATAGLIFYKDKWRISYMLMILAATLLFFGIRRFIKQKQLNSSP